MDGVGDLRDHSGGEPDFDSFSKIKFCNDLSLNFLSFLKVIEMSIYLKKLII
jgi:hypothetical protein